MMSRMRTFLSLLALMLLMPCEAHNYSFKTVDLTTGLADNFVRDIVRDSHGYMWFSTINGLSRYDGYRIYNYMPQEDDSRSNDINMVRETADAMLWMDCSGELYTYQRTEDVWKKNGSQMLAQLGIEGRMKVFYVDDDHNLWVATDAGLYSYDYAKKKLIHFNGSKQLPITHIVSENGTTVVMTSECDIYEVMLKEKQLVNMTKVQGLNHSRDSRIFLDRSMNLWIYNSHALVGTERVFSLKKRQWLQIDALKNLGDVFVNVISQDPEGRIWVGTGNAGAHVFEYQQDGNGLRRLEQFDVFETRSSHISCLYSDVNNTMWVGSAKLGVAFTDLGSPDFNIVSTDGYEDVSALMQDMKGNLWIAFDGAGIMRKAPDGSVTHFSAKQGQIPSDIVTSLTLVDGNTILAGTYGAGISMFNGKSFTPFYTDYPNLKYVKSMTTDARGNLWVATVDKGVVRVRPDGRIINYTSENSLLMSNGVLCLANDSLRDVIYIGTSAGISAFDCAKEQFIDNPQLDEFNGLYVSSILVCKRNMLWIGSRSGLWIYRTKDGGIDHLTTERGLSHNTIRALAKSANHIWASTDNGLTCVTISTNEQGQVNYSCQPFFQSDGLNNTIFSNNATMTQHDGTILLGCYDGYVCIQSELPATTSRKFCVQITNSSINGVEAPEFFKDYTIEHDERLSLFLSAMMPAMNHRIKYFYRFKGDKGWMRAPGDMLYFVALQPGKYILQVKAEMAGMAESPVTEMQFRVLPPLWLTKTAILFYILALIAVIYLIYRFIRQRQNRELAIKQLEINLKKYEVEEDKIRFFTNVSHDLKTPLTLVVAPLEKIRQANIPASLKPEVDVAWRNARQLQDLVMELLDFRRLDVGKEKLNLRHGDIVGFVRQTAQGFAYYATLKQVKMQLNLPTSPLEIDFDENKMRRIITNLLSNAYKYNTDNGLVTVNLTTSNQQLFLTVADTGIGVSDKKHIFDRFVQETHGQEQEGSGLGLHIVKQYVDMMNGKIEVADNHPKGTIFTVSIPITHSAGRQTEQQVEDPAPISPDFVNDERLQGKTTIMVVDDNKDARDFLQRSLEGDYNVLMAENGKIAIDMLQANDYVSLVVSDVMMPEMDGIELFRWVKSNIRFSHIPFILLTAKSGEENIVSGLKEGVADYITKPFSLSVLQLRIKKILEWTSGVSQQLDKGIDIKPSEITVSSLDEELISKVIAYIEANMQNIDYSVAQLSSDVGMTRGHLYKKLLAITGKSPLEFMRIIKLKRGKSLLEQGRTNISEVADRIGMSPKQFSIYFKQMFGETPSDFVRKSKSG